MSVKQPGFRAFALLLGVTLAPLAACARVDYVEIEPNTVTLRRRGEGLWLRAKPMSRQGVYYPRTPVTWTTDNPKVCSIDSVGRITAVGPGHAAITAEAAGRKASIDVDVETVESVKIDPATVTLLEDAPAFHPKITPLDGNGHELRGRTIDMKAGDANVIDVDGENLYPVSPGHTVVTVRADDRNGTIDVTVVAKGKGGAPKKPAPKK